MNKGLMIVLLASAAPAMLAAAIDWRVAPLLFGMLLLTLWPLARRKRLWFVGDVESEYAIVSRRREEALRALKDLEDDRLAGRVDEASFTKHRAEALDAAKRLTVQLDQLTQRRAAARKKIDAELAAMQSAKAAPPEST